MMAEEGGPGSGASRNNARLTSYAFAPSALFEGPLPLAHSLTAVVRAEKW